MSLPGPQPGQPAPDFRLPDPDGVVHSPRAYRGRPLVLSFARHYGCAFCRDWVAELRDAYERVRALGGAVLVITREAPDRARAYAAELRLPFPVLSDERGVAFRAYGLLRGRRYVLQPRLLLPYLRAAARRGQKPPGRDVWQLGGDFVLDREGRIALAHPSRDPMDRPGVAEVLGAVARHHAAVVRGERTRVRPPYPDEAVPGFGDGLLFVAETAEGPAAVLGLTWPGGVASVLRRESGRWSPEAEADALAALRAYVRDEWGTGPDKGEGLARPAIRG